MANPTLNQYTPQEVWNRMAIDNGDGTFSLRSNVTLVADSVTLTENVAQLNGNTISLNSGVADAGTQRVTVAANVATLQPGQAKIAVTGTAVALSSTSQVLQNGLVITSKSSNNAALITVGTSAVTNTTDGTGNGGIVAPGGSISIPSGVNLNTIYFNGTAGDIISFIGS